MININNYGFLNKLLLKEQYWGKELPTSHMDLATTREFSKLARHHCAAVMLMNIALYYKIELADRKETFAKIHKQVGNGPVLFLKTKAERAFKALGASPKLKVVSKREELIWSIDQGYPIGLLVVNKFLQMHWIMVVGYRYYKGDLYLLIVDGWTRTITSLYKVNGQSRILRGFSFKI